MKKVPHWIESFIVFCIGMTVPILITEYLDDVTIIVVLTVVMLLLLLGYHSYSIIKERTNKSILELHEILDKLIKGNQLVEAENFIKPYYKILLITNQHKSIYQLGKKLRDIEIKKIDEILLIDIFLDYLGWSFFKYSHDNSGAIKNINDAIKVIEKVGKDKQKERYLKSLRHKIGIYEETIRIKSKKVRSKKKKNDLVDGLYKDALVVIKEAHQFIKEHPVETRPENEFNYGVLCINLTAYKQELISGEGLNDNVAQVQKLVNYYKEQQDDQKLCKIYNLLGLYKLSLGNFQDAFEAFECAIKCGIKIGRTDDYLMNSLEEIPECIRKLNLTNESKGRYTQQLENLREQTQNTDIKNKLYKTIQKIK